MKTAIASSCFRMFPVEWTFRAIAEAGYDGLELYGGRPIAYPDDLDNDTIRNIINLQHTYHLEIPLFCPDLSSYPFRVAWRTTEEKEATYHYLEQCLEAACRLDIPAIRILCGHAGYRSDQAESWKRIEEILEPLCRMAEKEGKSILIQPQAVMDSNTVMYTADAMDIISEINSPSLGILIDTMVPFLNRESLEHSLYVARDRLSYIHLADCNGTDNSTVLLGNGMLNLPELIREIIGTGYGGWVGISLPHRYLAEPLMGAVTEKNALETILKQAS